MQIDHHKIYNIHQILILKKKMSIVVNAFHHSTKFGKDSEGFEEGISRKMVSKIHQIEILKK